MTADKINDALDSVEKEFEKLCREKIDNWNKVYAAKFRFEFLENENCFYLVNGYDFVAYFDKWQQMYSYTLSIEAGIRVGLATQYKIISS